MYSDCFGKLHKVALLAAIIVLPVLSGCDRLGTPTPEQHIQKARSFEDKGDLRASIIELKNALEKNPNDTQARLLLGKVYVGVQQGQDAEKELLRAQKLGLTRNDILPVLVQAILLQGDLDRALAESGETISDMPKADHAAVLGLRGQILISPTRAGK